MTSKGTKPRSLAGALILAFVFSAVLSGIAVADDGRGGKPPPTLSDRPTTQIAQPRITGNGGISTMAVSPYGCEGTSDNIHPSGSPGLLIGRAWSRCNLVVQSIETWSRLYKWNCVLFIFCGWDQVGADYKFVAGPTTGMDAWDRAEAIAASNCVVGGGDYRSEGDHRFVGYDAVTYYAFTGQNSTHVVC